ncbi:hypothetical protein DSCW_21290 [Desulfosarcina widdelii]|uniref:4Fe-4S ferredoxin-type domain-containing protein n=1 Tax=Desulfosarcina widdelii TaxID=947919 RepID=A0A5K7YYE0_9BACT|nr:FAD-dependent oxidoreductase [Desulfosarcina widdelii]BBO74712.1 hypothetical protein DSCW_21290 [Desulfosarcina widdelii]
MNLPLQTGEVEDSILVVGGGVAGISAALDLARAGRNVHLVERNGELGGWTVRLDKLYPTDHCGFCPVWSEVRLCQRHPRITVHTWTTVVELESGDGFRTAVLHQTPNAIDPDSCICCGRCAPVCQNDAVALTDPHIYPPAFRIDAARCNNCGLCIVACPTGAIDLHRQSEGLRIRVQGVVWATGFEVAALSNAPELGPGSHPDIMDALAFENWIAEAGPNQGRVRCHDGRPAAQVAFIQCAGARDRRSQPQCSAVCCMHALKQARWVRRRNGDVRCVIFYTDMRTEGRGYETYFRNKALTEGIQMIRARPGLVYPLPGGDGIAVKYENTLMQTPAMERFDLVVLNGGLRPVCPEIAQATGVSTGSFVEEGARNVLSCGFCKVPADVEMAAIQGSAVAMEMLTEVLR